MDVISLLCRRQLSFIPEQRFMTPQDKRAHEQFAREYAEQTLLTRAALAERGK